MRLLSLLGVAGLCSTVTIPCYAQATFQGLGTPETIVRDVAPDGKWIGGVLGLNFPGQEYFRWDAGSGVQTLPIVPASSTVAGPGLAAGGSPFLATTTEPVSSTAQATLWSTQGLRFLGGLLPGGAGPSDGTAISGDGSVVVGNALTASGVPHGFLWTAAGGMVDLDPLNTHWVADVSVDGQVVVGVWNEQPALWSQGSWQSLTFSSGIASSVNADGTVVVGSVGLETFRWTAAGGLQRIPQLNVPGTFGTWFSGLDGAGDTAVGHAPELSGGTGFVWRRGAGTLEVTNLLNVLGAPNLSGWDLESVEGISLDGLTLAGNGRNPAGQQEGWVATLPQVVTTYCTAKVNSQGCLPAIDSDGTPSASSGSGFHVSASNLVDNANGLLVYSTVGPASTPFQGGFLCVQPPALRSAPQNSGGSGPCTGTLDLDFNAYVASGADPALVGGAKVWAQYWSRDPASPSTTNLTDAVEFTLWP